MGCFIQFLSENTPMHFRSPAVALLAVAFFGLNACAQESAPVPAPQPSTPAMPAKPAASPAPATPGTTPAPAVAYTSLYDISVPPLSDAANAALKPLAEYKGKVALVVNVASQCGYTPQYKGLQQLYKELALDGQRPFTILAFPSNDFGEQEPGGVTEISKTCEKYSVTFPVFGKISVTGDEPHALYRWIVQQPKSGREPPKWNFTKFLVDHNGQVVARFDSRVGPGDADLRRAIAELLAATPTPATPASATPAPSDSAPIPK